MKDGTVTEAAYITSTYRVFAGLPFEGPLLCRHKPFLLHQQRLGTRPICRFSTPAWRIFLGYPSSEYPLDPYTINLWCCTLLITPCAIS